MISRIQLQKKVKNIHGQWPPSFFFWDPKRIHDLIDYFPVLSSLAFESHECLSLCHLGKFVAILDGIKSGRHHFNGSL